jgi:hypothetical protein
VIAGSDRLDPAVHHACASPDLDRRRKTIPHTSLRLDEFRHAGIGFQLAAQAQDLHIGTAVVDLVVVIRLCPPQDGADTGLVWPVVHPPTDTTTAQPAINTTILLFTSLCSRNGFLTRTVDFISWASQV